MRTYGNIKLSDDKKQWIISGAEPHICLKLKAIFVKIKRSATQPFKFLNTPETCHDLLWFTERYPLAISEQDASVMKRDKKKHINTINELEQILMPGYNPMPVKLNEGFEARHYQLSGVDVYMKCKRILIGDDIGLGKAEWVENDIFTPNGTKKMKDIQIGDYVIGSNGKPVKVSGVYPQGEKEMYRVHFNDGASVVVCEDHLWAVKNSVRKKRGNEPIILSVKEMLDENLEKTFKVKGYNSHRAYRFRTYYKIQNGKKQDGTYRWHIPITKSVSFKEQNVLIDPYLLGALLGDGGITNSIIFTSSDNQILETVSDKLPEGICLKKKKNSKYDYAIINKNKVKVGEKNMLTEYLRHYGLFGHKSDTKFIPDEYKFNSIENRISLLQGLMDTDGYVTSNKRKINSKTQSSVIGYTTTSKRLADDVLFLIQSLGGIATVSNKIPSYTHKGEKKKGKRAYTLVINLPDICPFRLKRKVDKCMPKLKYKPYRCISNIEYVGKLEAKCIKVEAEDHLYLTENFIVTHNTLIGILSCLSPQTRPCVAVVQTHLPKQWKAQIEMFTNLTVHLIKGTKPYDLPPADIYITKYSCLAGWANVFEKGIFKSAIFDEIQELRHEGTAKYEAAMALSRNVEYCLGLSATPIYNYGNEIYNVLDIIKEKCLGDRYDFLYEWCGFNYKVVREPQALGTYLRENFLLLRRTRAEVGRELPPINKIVHTVGYNESEAKKAEDIAKQLAIKATTGAFTERGQAFRELDALIRHTTGVSKAVEVAEYVKILLENNEPIVLAGWHREVYDIWMRELKDYKPVLYTGSESPAQKEEAKRKFVSGETNLFIISLRSGIGLDGLQHKSNIVVIGELDWSPKVHDQLIGRLDREGQKEQVTAIYLVSDFGSDPLIVDMLGVKSSQSHNIINPLTAVEDQFSDESRLKLLAEKFLEKKVAEK